VEEVPKRVARLSSVSPALRERESARARESDSESERARARARERALLVRRSFSLALTWGFIHEWQGS
jgi:hypothetical protein